MEEGALDIPPAWQRIDIESLHGVLLVVGGVDAGKTTFSGYLFQQLKTAGRAAAYVDGDPGQTSLGPPGTLTLTSDLHNPDDSGRPARTRRWFVGSISPVGHTTAVLTGAGRLVQSAVESGAQVVVFDTSGYIDPLRGGPDLKLAKIDLLRPGAVFAIQRSDELEPLLAPLRRSRRTQLFELAPSPAVARRGVGQRRAHRARQFARHFAGARPFSVDWPGLAVFPRPRFIPHRLLAFEDVAGFTLALGIVTEMNPERRRITVLTPLPSLEGVDALRLGDLVVDPETFRDKMI